ncbi:MAG: hypothetical protein M3Y54_04300 [Bacteroidota bacterium]|nr:hypothetical protein [Bacteroidota bacterium]
MALIFRKKRTITASQWKVQAVGDAGFIAYEQGFEAVKPRVTVFDHGAPAIRFGVKKRVVGLPIGGAAVAGTAGFDAARGTCQA